MDLTTLAAVKAWMSIRDNVADAKLSALITAISAEFMRAVNRLDFAPAADYTEKREGEGGNRMLVRHWPVNSVTLVKIAGSAVTATFDEDGDPEKSYEIYLDSGEFTDGADVVVTYNAGYATSPADVSQAICEWVADRFYGRTAAGVSQQGANDDRTVYEKPSIPLPVQAVIERYARKWPSLSRRDDDRELKMLRAQRQVIVG